MLREKVANKLSEVVLWRSYYHFYAKRLLHRYKNSVNTMIVLLSLCLALGTLILLGTFFSDNPTGLNAHRNLKQINEVNCSRDAWMVGDDQEYLFLANCNKTSTTD